MVVFFFFWFRVFVNEFNNYFVQNVYYITLQLLISLQNIKWQLTCIIYIFLSYLSTYTF